MTGPVGPYNSAGVDVTSITGSANGYNFQGVVDPGATDSQTIRTEYGYSFDNVLYPASGTPHTDTAGFLLYLNSPLGTSLAHVYYAGVTSENPGGYEVDVVDPNEPGASTPFGVATPFSVRRFSIARHPQHPRCQSLRRSGCLRRAWHVWRAWLFGAAMRGPELLRDSGLVE